MKKSALLFSALCLSMAMLADNYKILQMNTPSVKIGEQLCKKGDVFSDEAEIFWNNDKQAFKAQNLETKEIRLFVGQDFKSKSSKSIKDYYLKTAHLSTRGSIIALSDLAEALPDTLYLCDSITIESPVGMNSDYYYFIKYKIDGSDIDKPVKHDKRNLIIEKSVLGDYKKDSEVPASLYFNMRKEAILVKDSMTIVIIPWDN